jgi:hypothetical protein
MDHELPSICGHQLIWLEKVSSSRSIPTAYIHGEVETSRNIVKPLTTFFIERAATEDRQLPSNPSKTNACW